MASVIRVKRRRGEDPAEALLLSCKRLRQSQEAKELQPEAKIESVLSFAGTISSKAEPISTHIREAIKHRKLHKELHPNSADFARGKPSVTSRVRGRHAEASHNSRYRVLSGKRALGLAELDSDRRGDDDDNTSTNASSGTSEKETRLLPQAKCSKELANDSQSSSASNKDHSLESSSNPSSLMSSSDQVSGTVDAKESGSQASEERVQYCIFDVEQDAERPDPFFGVAQQSASEITVNGKPVVCRKAEPEPTDDSQFVYDLYYTHSSLADLDLQAALTVEALCDAALVHERYRDEDGEEGRFVHEDSDDSNDESNWRNDYPDEDPHFFENEDYDYAEDMVDTGYLNEEDNDLLAYWMDSRCNLETRSDDEEDEYEDDKSSTLDD